MRIVDVCAFYSPWGGGVRTYVDAKLRAAASLGHEMIVVAPGERNEVVERSPGAILVTLQSPLLPVDRRYRYFDDERALHDCLDLWQPDHVEASSPWSSATMVGRWQGSATRSLIMHSDPMASYAYRWFSGIAPRAMIDRWFDWFWRHLRGLDRMFDIVVSANVQLTQRLRDQGLQAAETVRMGVEPALFSPGLRSSELRASALRSLGLDPTAVLLIGVGRLAAEKRWDMIMRAVGECRRTTSIGLLIVGDGTKRQKLQRLADRIGGIALLPRIDDRTELARLLASADALVHGCESETFCMVAAEARASGIPLIVPDTGAALDQQVPGAGSTYAAANARSLERAIRRFVERGPELQRATAVRASVVPTIRDHFAELFDRYAALPSPARIFTAAVPTYAYGDAPLVEPALARSAVR